MRKDKIKNGKVVLFGSGGPAGIGFSRCISEEYDVLGIDDSKWARHFIEGTIIEKKDISYAAGGGFHGRPFFHAQPDKEVFKLSREVRFAWTKPITENDIFPIFMPTHETIKTCQDKYKCAIKLGDLAPVTKEILTVDDIIKVKTPCWIRAKVGAGGKDHYKFNGDWDELKVHIKNHKDLIVSEYLPGDNWSVDTVWREGTLLGSFTKKRISYSLTGDDNESGGSSMVSQCVKNDKVLAVALDGIQRISKPNGIMSVDLKGDGNNEPKITEINPGRFMTASLYYFYLTGYNLALMYVDHAFGRQYKYNLGTYPEGKILLRQTNCEPKIIDEDEI